MICFDAERQPRKAINDMKEDNEWEVRRFRANGKKQSYNDKDI